MSGSEGGNILSQIAHPQTFNLLQAYQGANQAAQGVWANRQNQANQLAGQAFQASINPDGTPNQAQLNQNLQAAGPAAALAAQDSSQKGQTLDQQTFDQNMKRLTYGAAGAAQILAANNGQAPQTALKAYYDQAAADGHITPQQRDQAESAFTADPVANAQIVRQRIMQNFSAQSAMQQVNGTPITVDDGQVVRGGVQNQTTGAISVPGAAPVPGGQGVQRQTGPEFNANQNTRSIPDPQHPGQFVQVPVARSTEPNASGVAPPLPGGPPAPIPYNGAYRPRGSVVGGGQPQPVAPAPNGMPTPAAASAPTPGAPGAQAAPPTPPTPTAAAPSPAVNPATGLPAGVNLAAPPQGQANLVDAGNKVYTDASLAKPAQQKRLIAGESALDALKLASTGPGSGTVAQIQAFSEAHGITAPPQGTLSAVDYRQILAKNLLRFAQSSGTTAGTDLGLETQIHSNANVEDMLPNANVHVMKQDLGVLRRDMAQTDTMPQGAAAIDHVKTFANTMDPRAFSWDRLEPAERSAIIAQANAQDLAVDKSGNSHPNLDKLRNSLAAALKSGYVKPDAQVPTN